MPKYSLSLNAVRRDPPEIVKAGAEGMFLRRPPINLAEAEFGIGRARQHLKLAIQEANRGRTLFSRGRAGTDKDAVGIKQRRARQRSNQREPPPRGLAVEEVKQLVLLDRAAE